MNRGFSLVELSIVLVILGLLTGGILTGQNLIRAAELRSVVTQLRQFQTATMTFRDKYFALPGDIANATQFWGYSNGVTSCTNNTGAANATNGVCDGNGNGHIRLSNNGANAASEAHQFWRHLAASGMVEGTYTGIAGSAGHSHCVSGQNCPAARLTNSMWGVRYLPAAASTSTHFQLPGDLPANHFTIGNNPNSWPQTSVLKPEEAWNIDKKMDDGRPAYGNVMAPAWANCTTATARTELDAEYNLTNSSVVCGLWARW
jgi:prepilin-type N-terminal cleavage/methylation domain-containing protein